MTFWTQFQRIANALFIYVLCGVLTAAYTYQFTTHENPCPLCLLQRLGMIGVAAGLLMNLRFGIRAEHYGLCILSALLGRFVSLRQIGLHVCPQFPTFGEPVLGYDLYAWAYIVFSCSALAIAALLIVFGMTNHRPVKTFWGGWEITAFCLVGLLVLGNFVTTLIICGLGACSG